MHEPTRADRVKHVARLLADQAIEVDAVGNRLRHLRLVEDADKALGLARQLTHLSQSIFGLGNADLNLFFAEGAKDAASSASTSDGAGVRMPWIKHL
jgi:hypothetical protein